MNDCLQWLRAPTAMEGVQLLGLALAAGVVWMLWRAQHAQGNAFDAGELFQDERDKTSGTKLVAFICALGSLWIVVFVAVKNGAIDPWLFVGWLGVVVLGKVGSDVAARLGNAPPSGDEHREPAPDPRIDKG